MCGWIQLECWNQVNRVFHPSRNWGYYCSTRVVVSVCVCVCVCVLVDSIPTRKRTQHGKTLYRIPNTQTMHNNRTTIPRQRLASRQWALCQLRGDTIGVCLLLKQSLRRYFFQFGLLPCVFFFSAVTVYSTHIIYVFGYCAVAAVCRVCCPWHEHAAVHSARTMTTFQTQQKRKKRRKKRQSNQTERVGIFEGWWKI